MANLVLFALIWGVVTRLTRFVTADRLTDRLRAAVIRRFGADSHPGFGIQCGWCVSPYVAAVIVPVAWLWGDTVWFQVPALALLTAQLAGMTTARFAD